MVKTVRGTVRLETLRERLTEHARGLKSYNSVRSEEIDIYFYPESISIELRGATSEKICWKCKGSGEDKDEDGGKCFYCDGTGKEKDYDITVVRIFPKQYPNGGKIAIQITNTNGRDISVWKPAVEKIKTFLEGLVGQPFFQIPMSKTEQDALKPNLMEMLKKTVINKEGV